MSAIPMLELEGAAAKDNRRRAIWRAIRRRPSAAIGSAVLAAFVVVALFAPALEPYSVTSQSGPVYGHPSPAHPLGLDDGGIDMISLLIQGTRISLLVGFAATLVSTLVGGTVGLLSGYFGGAVDGTLMRVADYFLVVPYLPLMIVIATVWGPSLVHIVLAIGLVQWAGGARVVRAQVKSLRERAYVQRARSLGAARWRVITRHILPHVAPLLVAVGVLSVAYAVFAETALSFLGLGDPNQVSWGSIIDHAFQNAAISSGAWWAVVPAGLCVASLVASCWLVGQAIEDSLNPRLRTSYLSLRRFAVRPGVPRAATTPATAVAAAETAGDPSPRRLLEVQDLHVWFTAPGGREVEAVRGISFGLAAGDRIGIVGESGAGKTTALLAILGLLPPDAAVAGRVTLTGEELLAADDAVMRRHRWRDIAVVFQGSMSALNPVRVIGAQIREPMELHGIAKGRAADARVDELLEHVGLVRAMARRYPHELSGGIRQRAAIAMALACEPKVLLADEPTTGLDVIVQAQILELLDRLARESGLALVLVTHDLPLLAQIAQRVLVMYAGEIVESAPIEQLRQAPRHPYTQRLLAATPDLRADHVPTTHNLDAHPAGDGQPALLEVTDLGVRYPIRRTVWAAIRRRPPECVRAVDGISFTLRMGEMLALVGESGAGKTTTARAVLRLLDVDAGQVRFAGRDITRAGQRGLRSLRRQMQLIYQDPYEALDPRFRVRTTVEEPLIVHRWARSKPERRARVMEALLRAALAPPQRYLDRYPHELSGGQRQRVAIAASMILDPQLVVADEPVSMLDVSARADILSLLSDLRGGQRMAVLMITHDISSAARYADRIAVMHRGRIVEQGPAHQVVRTPAHPYTRALIAAVPVLDPQRPPAFDH